MPITLHFVNFLLRKKALQETKSDNLLYADLNLVAYNNYLTTIWNL